MSIEKQLSVGPSPTAKLQSRHGSPREAAQKGELDALGLEKLIILEKNAGFIAQSDTVDNIMLESVKNGNTHCIIHCGPARPLGSNGAGRGC